MAVVDSDNYVTTSNVRNLGGQAVNAGVSLGNAVTSKVSLYGKTPIVQPAATAQSAVAATTTTTATTTALETDLDALRSLVLAMRTAMVNLGVMKGSA